jgi:hypothetical protein
MGNVIQSICLHTVETQGKKPVEFRKAQDGCLEITFEGKTIVMSNTEALLLKAFMLRKDW